MKNLAVGEGLLERLLAAMELLPVPAMETASFIGARAIMAATHLGVFEALRNREGTASEIASYCGTDPRATQALLKALCGLRYLAVKGASFRLTRRSRRWLLRESPRTIADAIPLRYCQWRWAEHTETFLRTGRPLDIQEKMTSEDWVVYQRAMRASAAGMSEMVLRCMPLLTAPTAMLEVGTATGLYSVLFSKRYATLKGVVLGNTRSVQSATQLIREENLSDRIECRTGTILDAGLEHEAFDLVVVGNVIHHFDAPVARQAFLRFRDALKPNGLLVIIDNFKIERRTFGYADLLSFGFAMLSGSSVYSANDVAALQQEVGFYPTKFIRFPRSRTAGLQVAWMPAARSALADGTSSLLT